MPRLRRQSQRQRNSLRRLTMQSGRVGRDRREEVGRDNIVRIVRSQNPEYRSTIQRYNTELHRRIRSNSEERAHEQLRNSQQHSQARLNSQRRAEEQRRNTQQHSRVRSNSNRRIAEQIRNTQEHIRSRLNPERRAVEQVLNTQHHSIARSNSQRRAAEQRTNTQQHSQARANPERRAMEQRLNTQQHSLTRSNSQRRAVEQRRNTQQHSQARSNPNRRHREQSRNTQQHSQARANPERRAIEQRLNTQQHSLSRSNSQRRAVEQRRNTQQHSQARTNPNRRHREQSRNTQQHSQARANPERRAMEQRLNTQQHSLSRSNSQRRAVEQRRNTQQHSQARTNPNRRHREQSRNTQQHSQARANPERRAMEQRLNTQQHSLSRSNPQRRAVEQRRNTQQHSQARGNPERRTQEQSRNTQLHSQRRSNSVRRVSEQHINTQQHALTRSNPERRILEQSRNTQEHLQRRSNINYREEEQRHNTQQHSARRSIPANREAEQRTNTARRRTARRNLQISQDLQREIRNFTVTIRRLSPTRIIEMLNSNLVVSQVSLSQNSRSILNRLCNEYYKKIKEGPTTICVCCGGCWFLSQTRTRGYESTIQRFNHPEVFYLKDKFPQANGMYRFCNSCYNSINKNKVPNICLSNGLQFPDIPEQLKGLTCLEERLISPRIPFMRIIALGYQRQSALRGAVVNIPISVNETVTSLPRTFNQSHVIQIHLKRRMAFNHDYITETVRPAKIIEAARYLISTELYRKHDIQLSSDWLSNFSNNEEVNFAATTEDEELIQSIFENIGDENQVFNEEEDELNPGGQETLLDNNPIENMPISRIAMAPGEGRRPLDITTDDDSEELSFPTIYCGIKRVCNETYSRIARSELRNYDRRCARPDKLFFSYKLYEILRIKNAISTCLRKKSGGTNHTAGSVRDNTVIDDLIQHDEGYQILRGLRSSPAHWEKEKKKVLAMIRQFGLPVFFITLSAAETKWNELLVILSKLIDNVIINEEEAECLDTREKFRLIRSDPVTCSRYFDHRTRQLFKLMKAEGGIFEHHPVVMYYWRVEFQHRGSPHIHGMYWLKNSPVIDFENQSTFAPVIEFADKFISTDGEYPSLQPYIEFQKHNHSRTCVREIRGQKVCRFNIPHPPMPNTEILLPLSEDCNETIHKKRFENIFNFLNENISNEVESTLNNFDNFLDHESINMSYADYKLALRSTIQKPKIFYKRKFSDRLINCFNPTILKLHRANMDIQFILDAYACCGYIINYINKTNRGVSKLMRDTMDEIRNGNFTVQQKLQHIGNKFINGTEISAQEAAYNILGMHLSETSNKEVYIDTNHPDKRVRILKPKRLLLQLPANSTDIFVDNLIDHYVKRPECLENTCLADFAAFYTFSKKSNTNNTADEENYEEHQEHEELHQTRYQLLENSGFIFLRSKPCIIRFRKFCVYVDQENYFRELIMLYYPWRNEKEDILDKECDTLCRTHTIIIEENRKKYNKFEERELENILQELHNEQNQNIEEPENVNIDPEFRVLAVPIVNPNENILQIDGNNARTNNDINEDNIRLIKLPALIPERELEGLVINLNERQQMYFYHISHKLKENKQICEFVSGGAGVGKSRLIKVIYQAISKRYTSMVGIDFSKIFVLLCAPTGKAAFGIGGATLHSAFSLPINQHKGDLLPLNNDICNSLYTRLSDLKLIIIDEISMIGTKMFSFLDQRLKQIFKTNVAFGGISIILFGDLRQLPPVGDKWIFAPNSTNVYSLISGTPLWNMFKFFELTEVMRQRDDRVFAEALNNMAIGTMTNAEIDLFNSRVIKNTNNIPEQAVHLFYSNKEVDNFNQFKLRQIDGIEALSLAVDTIKANSLPENDKRKILDAVKNFKSSDTQGLTYSLTLKESAKYMVTININTQDGLVNGASGLLKQIDIDGEGNPTTVWIHFPENSVGAELRSKKSHSTESLWTPIEKTTRNFQYKQNQQVQIYRKQFPIVPAEGITIHKSQGATYSKVVVHLSPKITRAAMYVACSRATSAEGLFIVGRFVPPKKVKDTEIVQQELIQLRGPKLLTTSFGYLFATDRNSIFYQNIQSLKAHINYIKANKIIHHCELLCFVESWTLEHEIEQYLVPGYQQLQRIESSEELTRKCRGIFIYKKCNSNAEEIFNIDHSCENETFQLTCTKIDNTYVVTLYRNNILPLSTFLGYLRSNINDILDLNNRAQIIIMGDFNICRRTDPNNCIEKWLLENGFQSRLDSEKFTTKAQTHIDWVFTNFSIDHAITFETPYSHHDAIITEI